MEGLHMRTDISRPGSDVRRVTGALAAFLCLAGCSEPLAIERFASTTPAFDPVTFWTGHTRSWGVIENRSGQPTEIVTTDCIGTAEGADGLRMVQTLTLGDGTVQHREWHIRRTAQGAFEASANDMVGMAIGSARGRAFHWSWTLATKPGDALRDVTMDQWMYLMDGGTMVNRTTIRKFGIVLAEVTEQFAHAP
jgi:hypothetical protein